MTAWLCLAYGDVHLQVVLKKNNLSALQIMQLYCLLLSSWYLQKHERVFERVFKRVLEDLILFVFFLHEVTKTHQFQLSGKNMQVQYSKNILEPKL